MIRKQRAPAVRLSSVCLSYVPRLSPVASSPSKAAQHLHVPVRVQTSEGIGTAAEA